jgi:hypothetical protein
MEELETIPYLYNSIWCQHVMLHYSDWGSQTVDEGIPALFEKHAVIQRKNSLGRRQMALTLVPCLNVSTLFPNPAPTRPCTEDSPSYNDSILHWSRKMRDWIRTHSHVTLRRYLFFLYLSFILSIIKITISVPSTTQDC